MPELPAETELLLRANAVNLRRAAEIEELRAALAQVEGIELSPMMEKLRRICEGLVASAPDERRGWQQMLQHEVLIEFDDSARPDPSLVAGWKRSAGERE